MSETDFRDDFRGLLQKHGQDLDAEDLRDLSGDLDDLADKWDSLEVTI